MTDRVNLPLAGVTVAEASVAALANQASNYLLGNLVPTAPGTAHLNIVPYQMFRSEEGQFVLAVGNDKLFQAACGAADPPDLVEHDRYRTNADRVANRDELINTLEDVLATKGTTTGWPDSWRRRSPPRQSEPWTRCSHPRRERQPWPLSTTRCAVSCNWCEVLLGGIGDDVTGYRPPHGWASRTTRFGYGQTGTTERMHYDRPGSDRPACALLHRRIH